MYLTEISRGINLPLSPPNHPSNLSLPSPLFALLPGPLLIEEDSLSASATRAFDKMRIALVTLVFLVTTGRARVWKKSLDIVGSQFYDHFRFDNITDPTNGRV